MKILSDYIYNLYQKNKTELWQCLFLALCIGLLAHGYTFFRNTFSHDSLQEFNAEIFGNDWKISLGRWFVPIYRTFTRGNVTLPLVVGMSSLIWIGLSSFVTIKIFDIKSTLLTVLITGFYVTNTTTTLTAATYLHDLDSNMFALFLSTVAALIWKRNSHRFYCIIPLVVVILGIYQAYISVTVTLMIMSMILDLIAADSFKSVLKKGIYGVLGIAAGGIIYYIIFKIILVILSVEEATGYNSLSVINIKHMILNFIKTFIGTPNKIISEPVSFPYLFSLVYNLLFIVAGFHCIIHALKKNGVQTGQVLLLIGLCICMPLGMNMCEVLTNGMSHSIMYFAFCLIYPFVFVLLLRIINGENGCEIFKAEQFLLLSLSIVVLIGNIRFSNQVYLRKELEQSANLSLFTRVINEIELVKEYNREVMPVCFIGEPENFSEELSGLDRSYHKTGLWSGYLMNYHIQQRYEIYFEYMLHYPISTVTEQQAEIFNKSDEINQMPVFPEDGCICIVDDTLIVKLGECDL